MAAFECRVHGVAVDVAPAHTEAQPAAAEAAAHERRHHASDPKRWAVYRDDEGWWIAERLEPYFQAQAFTYDAAMRIVDLDTLRQLAGDEWSIRTYNGRISLQPEGTPWTHQFYGATALGQAITFLREIHRQREARAARDQARALADVAIDAAQHLAVAALAKHKTDVDRFLAAPLGSLVV